MMGCCWPVVGYRRYPSYMNTSRGLAVFLPLRRPFLGDLGPLGRGQFGGPRIAPLLPPLGTPRHRVRVLLARFSGSVSGASPTASCITRKTERTLGFRTCARTRTATSAGGVSNGSVGGIGLRVDGCTCWTTGCYAAKRLAL